MVEVLQPVQRHEHPRQSNVELLGLLERARARQLGPRRPGFLRSSRFGQAVTTAGGVFGSRRPARLPARPCARRSDGRRDACARARPGRRPPRWSSARSSRVGIFLTPAPMMRERWRRPLWLLAGLGVMGGMALCGALCYGELAARYPRGGRRLRLPARGVRARRGVPLRLEVPARHGPGHHGGARDGSREPTRRTSCRSVAAGSKLVAHRRDRRRAPPSTSLGVRPGARRCSASLAVLKLALLGGDRGVRASPPAAATASHFVPFVARRPGAAAARCGARRRRSSRRSSRSADGGR